MGVVYKITQDVIDFIVRQKTENPSVGCRQLADSVSQKFSLKISKSSVNTVLRNANLSGSVGRPYGVGDVSLKRFQIPLDKKKELLERALQAQGDPDINEKKSEEVPTEQLLKLENNNSSQAITVEKDNPVDNTTENFNEQIGAMPSLDVVRADIEGFLESKDVPAVEPMLAETRNSHEIFWEEVQRQRQQRANRVEQRKGAGVLLLKMTEEALFPKNFWSDLFKKYWPEMIGSDFDMICRSAAMIRNLCDDTEGSFPENDSVLWQFYDIKEPERVKIFLEWAAKTPAGPRLVWDFRQKMEELLFPVDKIVLGFGKKEEFVLNAAKDRDASVLRAPLYRTVTWFFDTFVCNQRPIVIHEPVFSTDLKKLLAFLNADPAQPFSNMTIFGANDQMLTQFPVVLDKKRRFILGIVNKGGLSPAFLTESRWDKQQPCYCEEFDEVYYVSVNQTTADRLGISEMGANPITILGVSSEKSGAEPQMFLLTNHITHPKEVLADYFWEKEVIFKPIEPGKPVYCNPDFVEIEESCPIERLLKQYSYILVEAILNYSEAVMTDDLVGSFKSFVYNGLCNMIYEKAVTHVSISRNKLDECLGQKWPEKAFFDKKYIFNLSKD